MHHTLHTAARLARTVTATASIAAITLLQPAIAAPEVQRSAKAAKGIYEIVFNPADNAVYVAAVGTWSATGEGAGIVVLDGKTLARKRVIGVGTNLPFGLALNAKTQRLYAGNTTTGTIAVYDARSGKELAVIRNGQEKAKIRQVAVDEATDTIFATVVGGFDASDGKPGPKSELWVIDGKTAKIRKIIEEPVKSATGLALDSTGRRLYVSDMVSNEVAVFEMDRLEALQKFATGAGKVFRHGVPPSEQKPESDTINITVDSTGKRIYAINQASGTVTVLDAANGKHLRTVKTGAGALSAKVHPQTGDLYVANRGDGTVTVVDGTDFHVKAHLSTGTHPQTIAINPGNGFVYVSNKAKGKDWNAKNDPDPVEPGGDTVTLIRP